MLSQPAINQRLASHFVGVRFDWEQGNHYKDKIGFILGTGDQLLLDPGGKIIPPPAKHDGSPARVYGRHGADTTPSLLDSIMAEYAIRSDALKIEWFFWPDKPSKRSGGRYPVSHEAIAGFARLPLAIVDGELPSALKNKDFLRWHVRQFIWVRGNTNLPSQIRIRRVKDGLKPGLSTELATLDTQHLDAAQLGQRLDDAWMEYMQTRPRVAKGYLDNPHGKWMRGFKDQMIGEDETVRQQAKDGNLLPPGRKKGEPRPYK